MIVKAKINIDVSPADLAESLARSPENFARFWFKFSEIAKRDSIDLEPFGREMAPFHGGIRKHAFSAIIDFMRYYERKEDAGR
jgi:hypothetical protein